MNSELDDNSDAIYHSLMAWLRNAGQSTIATATQLEIPPTSDATEADIAIDELDLLDFDQLQLMNSTTDESALHPQSPNIVEIPIVESRFQHLLKTRLKAEIECRPPLFPWETDISDYEPEPAQEIADRWLSPVYLWASQFSQFNLPVAIPETVLSRLLETCSEVVQSKVQLGAKMVRAAQELFPERSPFLNQLAGLVLLYPTRSHQEQQLFPSNYENATPEQQMALSLLAAREMINTLTLPLSTNQPVVERQWQTAVGQLTVKAQYQVQAQSSRLLVQSYLPTGGSLQLQTGQSNVAANTSASGEVSVESFNLPANQIYPLEIRLQQSQEKPLIFAIAINN